jgi:uncharacterized protein YfiM (DUF2279 family)
MGLGIAKELSDNRRGGTGFSLNDIYHDGIGAAAGLMPFTVSLKF